MKGKFIYVLGIDGSGKTSLVSNIQKYINQMTPEHCIAILGYRPFTNELDSVAGCLNKNRRECFTPYFRSAVWALDLINKSIDVIEPNLIKGKIVIADRYDICNKVYSYINTQDIKMIDRIHHSLVKPDIYFYLDIDYKTAYNRIIARGNPLSPKESLTKLQEAVELYKYFLKRDNIDVIHLDASLSEDELLKKCIEILSKKNVLLS